MVSERKTSASATLGNLRQDVVAGLSAACVILPISISAGVLTYTPIGAAFVAQGALAGLYTAIIAGALAATFASSTFIITSPLPSVSIILAALAAHLMGEESFAREPHLIMLAIALCVLLAGALQILFGLLNISRIIKFTPYSVIAGFINSVGLLIILSQLRPFFATDGSATVGVTRPTTLIFIILLFVLITAFSNLTQKIPAPLFGLVVGSALYYGLLFWLPGLPLGPTIGPIHVAFPSGQEFFSLQQKSTQAALLTAAPQLLITALTVAAVATLQCLLAFRVAQTLGNLPPRPPRDLVAQGIGNCASALTGGIVALAATAGLAASFRAGGKTRVAGLTCALLIFLMAIFGSSLLAQIPVAVLSAILVGIGFQIFDRWTFQLLRDAFLKRAEVNRRQTWQNLAVVVLVMLVSAGSSIVAGAMAGFVLACLIFILNMTRPVIRRRHFADEAFSKRIRSASDMAILLRTGRNRAVIELQGVLFFGNADDLSSVVNGILKDSRMVLLDCRGISEVDVSGAMILANLVSKSCAQGKRVLFCNVPANSLASIGSAAGPTAVFPDFDTGLEWMEEEELRGAAEARPGNEEISLRALDMLAGFESKEIEVLESKMTRRDFPPGTVLCNEHDDADRMWVLTKGSVSIRLRVPGRNESRRIASVAVGTTVGEMALLENSRRSATVVADEEVVSYELTRLAFENVLREYPQIGLKLLKYLTRELARRMRLHHRDLRGAIS